MTHTQKRKIYLDGIEYEWCIRGNDLWVTSAKHITIYKSGINGRPLYLDPYPWALEIRPKTIKRAIEFANRNGWIPENKGRPFLIGYLHEEFVVLPEGITSSHEYQEMLNNCIDRE